MAQIIEHTGIINHIERNIVKVLIIQQSACSSCHAKGSCSASEQSEKTIEIETSDSNYKVGDFITIYGQSSLGLLAVLFAFVIPFLLILLVLLLLQNSFASESISGILALLSLIPYYIILSFFKNKLKSKFRFSIKKDYSS